MQTTRQSQGGSTSSEPPSPTSFRGSSSVESTASSSPKASVPPSSPASDKSQHGSLSSSSEALVGWWKRVTKEELDRLREKINPRGTGKMVTDVEMRLTLATLFRRMVLHKGKTTSNQTLNYVLTEHAHLFGMAPQKLHDALSNFVVVNQRTKLDPPERKKRERDPLEEISITPEHEEAIRAFVQKRCRKGKGTKLPQICRHLRRKFNTGHRGFSTWVVRYYLINHMGWCYVKLTKPTYI